MTPAIASILDDFRALVLGSTTTPTDAHAVAEAAIASSRPLTKGWWHGGDVEQAIMSLTQELEEHGLADDVGAAVRSAVQAQRWEDEDDEDIRRAQLGVCAVLANGALERRGSANRFRCFSRKLEWETDEPFWVLVDAEEHAALLRLFGGPAPGGLEAAYDAAKTLEDVPADLVADQPPLRPDQAVDVAQTAAREGRWADALAAAEIGATSSIVAELIRIEALMKLGRREDASAAWRTTAERWLSGTPRVYQGWPQWGRLAELGAKLGLGDDELAKRVNSQR